MLLGTSLTAGLGLDPDNAYPALLQRKADSAGFRITIINAGLSGETSAGALRRAAWVLDQPAAAVVLEVGANDGLRGVDPDSTYANIVALLAIVKKQQPEAKALLVQMEAPVNIRGRVIGLYNMSSLGMRAFAGVTVGLLGSLIGIHWSLALSALMLLATIGALSAFTLRRR